VPWGVSGSGRPAAARAASAGLPEPDHTGARRRTHSTDRIRRGDSRPIEVTGGSGTGGAAAEARRRSPIRTARSARWAGWTMPLTWLSPGRLYVHARGRLL